MIKGCFNLRHRRALSRHAGWDISCSHDFLGKLLAALEHCSLLGGAKNRNPLGPKGICHTCYQRSLWADDGKINLLGERATDHLKWIGRDDAWLYLDLSGYVFIAWSTNDVLGRGAGSNQCLHDRVLSSTRANNEDSHLGEFTAPAPLEPGELGCRRRNPPSAQLPIAARSQPRG